MAAEYVLGIDLGTSGCKSIIVDGEGDVVVSRVSGLDVISEKQGYSEQNPAHWWEAVRSGIGQIKRTHRQILKQVRAIGLSAQMHGLVALDKNHTVLRNAILWNDQRTGKQCDELHNAAGGVDRLIELTNNKMLPGYTGGKIVWLREYEPENFRRAAVFLNPKDYIRLLLTGTIATDVSDASGTGLFDVKNRVWSKELLRIADIPEDKLPGVFESTEITGTLTKEAASELGLEPGIPVVGGGGDAVIQTTGTGVIDGSMIMTIIGSAGIVATGAKHFHKNPGARLQFFCNTMPETWHIMGVTLAAGASYKWFAGLFGKEFQKSAVGKGGSFYEYLNGVAAGADPGSKGLVYLPYLGGERCPYVDPEARACFVGLTLRHTKSDITRSILEGVVYSLRDVFELIKDLNRDAAVDEIRMSGGGAQSSLWRQIHADVFQLPVATVSGAAEGGAYGAALLAGTAVNFWRDVKEATGVIKKVTSTEPRVQNKSVYEDLYGVYRELYQALKFSFPKLRG